MTVLMENVLQRLAELELSTAKLKETVGLLENQVTELTTRCTEALVEVQILKDGGNI